ncbi:MAG: ABC transporter permease [Peptococcaceae bacterium]|nr:ABC transporter permease [Peptococcaceae bacterium]
MHKLLDNKFVNGLIGFALVLLFWQIGSMLLNKPFLPTPSASFAAFFAFLLNGEMGQHFLISTFRIIASILLAMALAIPLGLAMGRVTWLGKLLNPIVYLLYPLPKVVFLPIIVVLMGLGNWPKIFLIALVVFFQIVVVTRDAASSIPKASIQSMRSLNASGWQMFRHLILPACLPQILTSLRITLGTAIAILFFAETFASFDGLGYFILDGMERREYPAMYAGIIGLAILGLGLYLIVDVLEQKLCRWQKK